MTVDLLFYLSKKTENMSCFYEHDIDILCVRVGYELGLPINYQ